MIAYYILLAACIPLMLVPPLFIHNNVYQDGVIGRAGLVGISFSAACLWIFHMFAEEDARVPIQLISMLAAFFALFLVWHLFRFHSRVLRERNGTVEPRVCRKNVEAP
jgi:hypothetical protein